MSGWSYDSYMSAILALPITPEGSAYNRAPEGFTSPCGQPACPQPRSRFPMTQTPTMPAEREHRAAKRYIYAFGGGRAEGDATMRDLLGGKGAGLAEMTNAGPAGTARLHDHDRGVQRLLRRRREAARRAVGRRPCRGQGGRAGNRQGLWQRRPTRSSSASVRAPSSRCPA